MGYAKHYKWTLQDIATYSGNAVETVRRHVREKVLNPIDLTSVANYTLSYKHINDMAEHGRKELAEAKLKALEPKDEK